MSIGPSISSSDIKDESHYWLEHVRLQHVSGLSRSAYCREHNLANHKFMYWEKKLANSSVKLLPVKLLTQEVKRAETLCTLVLKNGNELKVHDIAIMPTLLSILS